MLETKAKTVSLIYFNQGSQDSEQPPQCKVPCVSESCPSKQRGPVQGCSNFHGYINHLGPWQNADDDSVGLGQSFRICISGRFSDEAPAGGPGATYLTVRVHLPNDFLGNQKTWVTIPTLLIIHCIILGKLSDWSVP